MLVHVTDLRFERNEMILFRFRFFSVLHFTTLEIVRNCVYVSGNYTSVCTYMHVYVYLFTVYELTVANSSTRLTLRTHAHAHKSKTKQNRTEQSTEIKRIVQSLYFEREREYYFSKCVAIQQYSVVDFVRLDATMWLMSFLGISFFSICETQHHAYLCRTCCMDFEDCMLLFVRDFILIWTEICIVTHTHAFVSLWSFRMVNVMDLWNMF